MIFSELSLNVSPHKDTCQRFLCNALASGTRSGHFSDFRTEATLHINGNVDKITRKRETKCSENAFQTRLTSLMSHPVAKWTLNISVAVCHLCPKNLDLCDSSSISALISHIIYSDFTSLFSLYPLPLLGRRSCDHPWHRRCGSVARISPLRLDPTRSLDETHQKARWTCGGNGVLWESVKSRNVSVNLGYGCLEGRVTALCF